VGTGDCKLNALPRVRAKGVRWRGGLRECILPKLLEQGFFVFFIFLLQIQNDLERPLELLYDKTK
jgi:hypothetical protein